MGIHLRLLGMALFWGTSWPAARYLALNMPAMTSAAWRFTLAAAILMPWLLMTQGWPRLTRRQWFGIALSGLVGVWGYAVLFMLAMRQVEAARGVLVVTTNPIFTTLLAAWIFGERINRRIVIGLLLALVGAATVLTKGQPWMVFSGAIGTGEWLLVGCIAAWVSYTLLGRKLLVGIPSLTATSVGTLIGSIGLWLTAMVVDGPALMWQTALTMSPTMWATLIFLAIGSTVLAYLWFNQGIAALGAGAAASYITLVPVFGVLSAVLVLGESLDASLLTGGALAVLGLALSNWGRR